MITEHIKLELSPSKIAWLEENPVLNNYVKMGYFNHVSEVNALHMAYSPYRIPPGLTKLQIRRKINYYLKHGSKTKITDLFGNRMEVFINGKFRIGMSFSGEEPQNNDEWIKLFKNLIKIYKLPDVEDKKVLGKFSC